MTVEFIENARQSYPKQVEQFLNLITEEKLSHLYLLVGFPQDLKLDFARFLAWQIVGNDHRNAQRIVDGDHPDVHIVTPMTPGTALKVAQIRALTPEFVTRATESSRKVFVLDAVETMTTSAANSLLKFIEEPAGPQLILMLTNNLNDVLPTIQSRAQIVHLQSDQHSGLPEITDDWLQQAQGTTFKWIELMMQRQIEAFAYVQAKLLPLIDTATQQQLFFRWLHEVIRDMMIYDYISTEDLKYPKLVGFYKSLRRSYTIDKLVRVSDNILADDKLRKVNISLQSRLEKIVLDTSIILGE
ncbi:DNA polymerase III subunit delta [Leuconostoc fallax]|uniref:DNA polymerase III subunit delta n=1 Tax=Leuconostoc fallax TaxID=1251 RepID=UPI002091472A|nr:DNA polymerase III subunit delta [Leuconostoc fallax]MCO6184420.1 DNA polymerase III subunit delta [Leuconostoc fallax]